MAAIEENSMVLTDADTGGPKTEIIFFSPFRQNEDVYRTGSGISPFNLGVIVFSSSIAFQNAFDHENPMTTSKVTLFFTNRNYKNVCAA